ncbi:hypothetical protein AA19596_1898 [Acetobacter fabarum DSM 19596]|nr:hypothetical protein AA19596_1898 [Acetobacter fabarum DSM 19596]
MVGPNSILNRNPLFRLSLYPTPNLYYAAPTIQEPFMVMQTVAQPVTANVIPGAE